MSEDPKIPAKRGRKPKSIETAGVIDRMDDDTDPAMPAPAASGIPPCPEQDPVMGMKTPEVIAWWYRYHPTEAKVRYHGLTYPKP